MWARRCLAPLLFALHAVLTGVSMALTAALGIRDGFGFSAGLIDYILNFGIAEKPLLILPIGVAYAVLYYVMFRVLIRRFDLPTPGRERTEEDAEASGFATPAEDRDSKSAADSSASGASQPRT